MLQAGSVVADAVELVDIYPTAAALTRSGPVANASTLDGIDFSPLLTAIGQARDRAVARPLSTRRLYTFSDFPRCDETGLPAQPTPWPVTAFEKNYCKSNKNSEISAMGCSLGWKFCTHEFMKKYCLRTEIPATLNA